jgi:hypothetical protein
MPPENPIHEEEKPSKKRKISKEKHLPEMTATRSVIPLIDSHRWIVPLSLFSLSFLFRVHFMNDGLFHHDEVILAKAVEGSMEKRQLLGAVNGRFGSVLLNILFYAPYKWGTGHNSEKIIVLTAILSGALLVVVIYGLMQDWYEDRASAFFSSTFIAFNFLFLTTSTTGKEHTHQILFVALAFWLFHRGARKPSLTLKILGLMSFAFAMTVHESTIPLIPVFIAFLVLANRSGNGDFNTQFRDLVILCVLLAFPFVLYLGEILRHTLTVKSTGTVSFLGLFSPILPMAMRDLLTVVGFALAGLALIGIAANLQKKNIVIPALLWILMIFYYGNNSGYAPRHLILIILPISILGGMGAGFLVGKRKGLALQVSTGLLLIIAVCGYGIYKSYPILNFRKDYCGPKKMAEFVKANTEPDATVITMDESVYIDYYARRDVISHPVAEYTSNREFVERVHTMALSGRKFYINTSAFSYDYQGHFEKFMVEKFQFLYVGEVLDELYKRPELGFKLFNNKLFRIVPK